MFITVHSVITFLKILAMACSHLFFVIRKKKVFFCPRTVCVCVRVCKSNLKSLTVGCLVLSFSVFMALVTWGHSLT